MSDEDYFWCDWLESDVGATTWCLKLSHGLDNIGAVWGGAVLFLALISCQCCSRWSWPSGMNLGYFRIERGANSEAQREVNSEPSLLPPHACGAFQLYEIPPLPPGYVSRPEVEHDYIKALLSRMDQLATSTPITSIVGTAGLGKTTTAIWLALQPIVHATFAGGVFWLVFGQLRDPVVPLLNLATALGLAESTRTSDPDVRIREARGAIAARMCTFPLTTKFLVILDDVWVDFQVDVFARLTPLVQGRLSLLLTTRNVELAERHANVLQPLQPLSETTSLEVLAQGMQISSEAIRGDSLAIQLVHECSCVPAMLRVAANLARAAGLGWTLQYLKRRRHSSDAKTSTYGSVYAALDATLSFEGVPRRRFEVLAIFPPKARIPLETVKALWSCLFGVISTEDAKATIHKLRAWHLVEVDSKRAEIWLIDLHRDYLLHYTRRKLRQWHALFLASCTSKSLPVSNITPSAQKLAPPSSLGKDMYWADREGQDHVLHHLLGASECHTSDVQCSQSTSDLTVLPFITEIDLSLMQLCLKHVHAVGWLLRCNASLTQLNISSNDIGPAGGTAIAESLANNASLTRLDLSDNDLFPHGEVPITELIGESFHVGAKVRVSQGYDGELIVFTEVNNQGNISVGDPTGIAAIAKCMRASTSLTDVDLRYNQLDATSATLLSAIAKGKGISLCGIHPDQTLADFTPNSNSNNRMQPADVILLTADLAVRASLSSLDMSGNDLGPAGGKVLAESLADRTSLSYLDVRHNLLGEKAKATLKDAVNNGVNAGLVLQCDDSSDDDISEGSESQSEGAEQQTRVLGCL
mmetsp:Transcript_52482/g.87067  ORF Transcript_52482/g.87067 Transcript_52482/m.87067 type:complete len:812 (+) Transcript_52482:96-2531(+)